MIITHDTARPGHLNYEFLQGPVSQGGSAGTSEMYTVEDMRAYVEMVASQRLIKKLIVGTNLIPEGSFDFLAGYGVQPTHEMRM